MKLLGVDDGDIITQVKQFRYKQYWTKRNDS